MNPSPALEITNIQKAFDNVAVLKGVSFHVAKGQTLALLGENGAGKSTLMNIVGGNLKADAGTMHIDGHPYSPRHPTEATRAGIAFIHQELNLFTNLSIAENLFLENLPRRAPLPFIDRKQLKSQARELLDQVGLTMSPDTLVERLSAGERQLVEIARALSIQPRLIIFDEPTTSLSDRETRQLFHLIRKLQGDEVAIIYISHILEHVFELCSHMVVLRDGNVVEDCPSKGTTTSHLVAAMVGRTLDQLYPQRKGARSDQPLLKVSKVTQPYVAKEISFSLQAGEVLGIAGLMGAGRSELARILFGLDPCAEGEIELANEPLTNRTPQRRIEQGLAFVTEERRKEGLCLNASIADNIAMVSLRSHARTPLRWISKPSWLAAIHQIREAVRLNPSAENEQAVKTLSGGNQQKVVLAKWLLAKPNILILDEPTRGVDVGAKYELYQLILNLADQGSGILLISSEIEELMGLSDRILVMCQGEIRGEFERPEFNRERLLEAALPKEESA